MVQGFRSDLAMRFITFKSDGEEGLGILDPSGTVRGFLKSEQRFPGNLDALVAKSDEALRAAGTVLLAGKEFDPQKIAWLPPLCASPKIICIRQNYPSHAAAG